ncbi:hypothetical protein STPH1_3410 [Streptomyces sp. OM5714]|nr:hypothetical protein STPH1_3410 [Streptomyces sp. OM5714]
MTKTLSLFIVSTLAFRAAILFDPPGIFLSSVSTCRAPRAASRSRTMATVGTRTPLIFRSPSVQNIQELLRRRETIASSDSSRSRIKATILVCALRGWPCNWSRHCANAADLTRNSSAQSRDPFSFPPRLIESMDRVYSSSSCLIPGTSAESIHCNGK